MPDFQVERESPKHFLGDGARLDPRPGAVDQRIDQDAGFLGRKRLTVDRVLHLSRPGLREFSLPRKRQPDRVRPVPLPQTTPGRLQSAPSADLPDVSSPCAKNISVFQKCKSAYMICHPIPKEGRWPSSSTRGGERWTRQCSRAGVIAGRILSVSGCRQRADERH
jgi:hypothetical protein